MTIKSILYLEANKLLMLVVASDPNSARREFLSYALSLMRSHNAEHADSLPVLDVSALRHIAYVFDALIYYMRSSSDQTTATEELRDANNTNNEWIQQVRLYKCFVNFCYS